jgi:SWI/SNF-related matrix-associated actin-dependent regulator of chromatin subfamily A-like protein 1
MGLGKSFSSLLYADRNCRDGPIVVVCPATIKLKWAMEASQHIDMKSHVIWGGTAPETCPVFEHPLIIINYEILIRRKSRGKKKTQPTWLDHLISLHPQLIIVDEGQNIANPSSIRTKAVKKLCKNVSKILILTGTPIENKPADLFPSLNILRPDIPEFSNPWTFYENFSALKHNIYGWDWSGASNLDKLNKLLKEHVMLRRRKSEVLGQLPPKTRTVIPLAINMKVYDKACDEIINWMKRASYENNRNYKLEERNRIIALKQLVGKLKLSQQIEWLNDWLKYNCGKIIVGTYHRAALKELVDKYKNKCVFIEGSRTGSQRQEAIDKFQNDPKIRIMFGQITAAGTGWDGTAANAVAIFELGWNPSKHDQLEARSHRIGSKNRIVCYYLVASETIDMEILKIIERKQGIIDQAINGVEKTEQSLNIFSMCIEALKSKYGKDKK